MLVTTWLGVSPQCRKWFLLVLPCTDTDNAARETLPSIHQTITPRTIFGNLIQDDRNTWLHSTSNQRLCTTHNKISEQSIIWQLIIHGLCTHTTISSASLMLELIKNHQCETAHRTTAHHHAQLAFFRLPLNINKFEH